MNYSQQLNELSFDTSWMTLGVIHTLVPFGAASRVLEVLPVLGDGNKRRVLAQGYSSLRRVLRDVWLKDKYERAWLDTDLNLLAVLVKVHPEAWEQIHRELIEAELAWPLHIDARYPHTNLLTFLDGGLS